MNDEPNKLTPERLSAAPPRPGFGLATVLVVALLCSGLASGATVLVLRARGAASSGASEGAADAMYQCPMHPSIVQDHPGDCPICGMKLVKIAAGPTKPAPAPSPSGHDDAGAAPPVAGLSTVDIEPSRQQLIGLKTVEVARGTVGGSWRTVGRVAIDETRVRHVNLKIPGFVERIYVDYVGKKVNRGDPLFTLYSPELLAAQEEYLLALRTQAELTKVGATTGNDGRMAAAARRKLALWDVPPAQLDKLAQNGEPQKTLTFFSPATGVVTKKDVVDGMRLEAGAMPYEIVDLSQVWVLADVYESELRFVKEDMAASLTLTAYPNREFKGKVVFLDPQLDPASRTVKVRLTFPNPAGELRPEMFGEVVLTGAPREGLRVPTDAVIDSGTEKVVFVAISEGRFEPRVVKLGDGDRSYVEILSGVALGERVVVRANFLVDSESRLRASLAEMVGPASPKAPESARVLPAPEPPAVGDAGRGGPTP
jgi:Cu(I)/Ag(I) efflux system membrane fusion protein